MNDDLSELQGRIDGLRMMLVVTNRGMKDPSDVLGSLMKLEHAARVQNAHAATIEEIAEVREALDDL